MPEAEPEMRVTRCRNRKLGQKEDVREGHKDW